MRITAILCLAMLALYGSAYVALRCTHGLVRRDGRWGDFITAGNWVPTHRVVVMFKPAWVLERKSRSLRWRIQNHKPWFGAVYPAARAE